jgi:hypothetical protein
VKAILSCFNCGRERHVAKDCRQRTKYNGSAGRDTDNVFGSVGRDAQYKDGAGRGTDNCNRAQGKGWVRSGNDRRELSSNPTTARRIK